MYSDRISIDRQNPVSRSLKLQHSGGSPNNILVIYDNGCGFIEKVIRHNFICKLYSIIFCQIMLIIGILCMSFYYDPFKEYLRHSKRSIIIITIVISFGTLVALGTYRSARQYFPLNFILMFLFTFAFALNIAVLLTYISPLYVLRSLSLTALMIFTLAIYAFQTKIDFTCIGGVLFITLEVIICGTIFTIFSFGPLIGFIISTTVAIVISIFLIYDSQMMIDGNYKYVNSPKEYILAATLHSNFYCIICFIIDIYYVVV